MSIGPAFRRAASALLLSTLLASLPVDAAEACDPRCEPLLPVPTEWSPGDTWEPGPVGSRDFYFVENGPYTRSLGDVRAGWVERLKQNGLHQRLITGYLPNRYLQWFDPAKFATIDRYDQKIIRDILEQRWPFFSIAYVTAQGKPLPSKAAFDAMGDLWLGDGAPEYLTYRFEAVMEFLRSGRYWDGSSSNWTDADAWTRYMGESLLPAIRERLPGLLEELRDPRRKPSHREARMLADTFMETYFEKIGKPVSWGDYLSPYFLAAHPRNVAVGQRNSDARHVAHARGIMRSAGGHKFFINWYTGEEAQRWHGFGGAYPELFVPQYEAHGYPLGHVRTQMWRPFLTGAHMFYMAASPTGFIYDVEGDGNYELNVLGEIANDILDFSEVLTDRGVAIASVGLLLDYSRQMPLFEDRLLDTSYLGLGVPFEDSDYMRTGILRLLFPKHRHTLGYGIGSYAAPYGEIFDVLSVNRYGHPVDPQVLASYKVLFDLGGLEVDRQFAQVLMDYVRAGGTLVMNVADLGDHLPPSFFGVAVAGGWARGERVESKLDRRVFEEERFRYRPLRLSGAEAVYTVEGSPLVTRNRVGRGHAILVASRYMNRDQPIPDRLEPEGRTFSNKPLLGFVPDLLDRLTADTMPAELRSAPEHRADLSWWVHKKRDSWLVFVMSYDQEKRYERRGGHPFNMIGDYEYTPIPFEIVFNVPVADGVELYGSRNVPMRWQQGRAIASDTIRFGEIRVYEFADRALELPARKRFVNYARGRPVEASTTLTRPGNRPSPDAPQTRRFAPELAVDGSLDNRRYWQSGRGDPGSYQTWNTHDMPSWLRVDLEQERLVDHVLVQFHHRPIQDDMDMRPRIIRYTVDVSENGRRWKTVVDESANAKPVRRRAVQKWFEPVRARYARLNVSWNSDLLGAQVVEFGVYGQERELYNPERRSPWEPARAWFPLAIQHWPQSRQRFLFDLSPLSGGRSRTLLGEAAIRTYDHTYWGGHAYPKVLGVAPPHEEVYAVPDGARYFAAVAGFAGLFVEKPGAVYRIFVDGEKRFDSGPYYGYDALPILVELEGARELALVVENLGDGAGSPPAYLAEARFLLDGSPEN